MAKKTHNLNVSIGAETKRLRKEMAKANTSLMRFKKSISKIGGSIGLAFGGAAVLGAIKGGITLIADFEEQMDKVAAISGATSKEVAMLTENARELGKTSVYTARQIAEMQEVLARLGFEAREIVQTTDAIQKLALVSGEEMATSAESMVNSLNAFNLSSLESERVANVMAESFAKSALNLERFSLAMSYAGASGKAAGFSIERVTSMIGILVDNGIQASKAGTGLRDMFIDLAKSGMNLDDALMEIRNSEDQLRTAFDLFGKTSANQAVILANNTEALENLNAELSDSNTELDKMAKTVGDNLNTDLKELKSAFEELVLEGSVFNGILRASTQALTELLRGNITLEQVLEANAKAAAKAAEQKEHLAAVMRTVDAAFASGNVEAYLRVLEKTGEQEDAIVEIKRRLNAQLEEQRKKEAQINELTLARYEDRERLGNPMEAQITYAKMAANANDAVDESIKRLNSSMKQAAPVVIDYQNNLEKLGLVAINLGEILQSAVATGITEMARAIGEAIVGVGNFGEKVLKIVGGFLEELGAAFIAAGTSAAIVQSTLATNPYTAIAAGAALVAIGAALSAQVEQSSKGFGASGGSFRSSYASSGSNSIAGLTNDDPLKLEGEFVLRGNDLVAAINSNNTRNRRTGGATITSG